MSWYADLAVSAAYWRGRRTLGRRAIYAFRATPPSQRLCTRPESLGRTRSPNPDLLIVARGEVPSTESTLLQAGADKVVLPTHIGAERIAELLLYEESARFIEVLEKSHGFQRVLHNFGMELEVITAAPQSPAAGMTVAAIERQAKGAFFIVQITRRDGDIHTAPPATALVGEGDGVVLIGRPNRSAILTQLFEARSRAGVRG